MIHVEKQPEPRPPGFDFDGRVRQPGLRTLAELTGQRPSLRRRSRRIQKQAAQVEDLPPAVLRKYPYWTRALDALHEAYRGICAYSCFYIEPISGPTVDHFVALARGGARQAYEWDNFRLAASLLNACKSDFPEVLDPFQVEDGWFELDLATFHVRPSPALEEERAKRVQETIGRLQLNSRDCLNTRRQWFEEYWHDQPVPFRFLEKRAPFLAREMRRQGRVRPGDRAADRPGGRRPPRGPR